MKFRLWCVVVAALLPALGQAATAAVSDKAASEPVILVMGDSLGASFGVPVKQGWATLLQQRLREQGYPHRVYNASISGETTAGGLARLPPLLKAQKPAIVLIELGANDALRGLKLERMRENLNEMIRQSQAIKAKPLLFEMRVPSNYGPEYTGRFTRGYSELAKSTKTPLVPFFLMPLAGEQERWFQDDGIHPNAGAQPLLLDAVWPSLKPLLGKPST